MRPLEHHRGVCPTVTGSAATGGKENEVQSRYMQTSEPAHRSVALGMDHKSSILEAATHLDKVSPSSNQF